MPRGVEDEVPSPVHHGQKLAEVEPVERRDEVVEVGADRTCRVEVAPERFEDAHATNFSAGRGTGNEHHTAATW